MLFRSLLALFLVLLTSPLEATQIIPVELGESSQGASSYGRRRRRRRKSQTTPRRRRSPQTLPRRRRTKPYEIEFGGDHRLDKDDGDEYDLGRPELVKSEQCTGNVCTDCSHRSKCWHGAGQDSLQVNVQAGITTEFAIEIWARCAKSGQYSVDVYKVLNGIILIYLDSVLFKQVTSAAPGHRRRVSNRRSIPTTAKGSFHLRVAFRPGRDASSPSEAGIEVKLSYADVYTDQCMGAKDCLKIFGDKSDAGFELRNSNEMQLVCLQGNKLLTPMALQLKCAQWLKCLPDAEKARLKTFLSASLGKPKPGLSMIQGSKSKSKDSTCFDPAILDPEAWDCDCFQNMIDACGGLEEECIKGLMCKNPKVCLAWKQQQCSSATGPSFMALAAKQRLMRRENSSSANNVGSDVDSTLRGKCAI